MSGSFGAMFLPAGWAAIVMALVQCALLLLVALFAAAIFIWLERKVSARIQDRLGPTRVGGRFGWLQPPADGLKLLCKEDLIPAVADRPLFRLAPYVSFCAVYCALLALPFAEGWVVYRMESALFFILAVLSVGILGVILAGYASSSKWSLFGAMREAAQVVSYEIPLTLCVLVPVLLAGTLDLTAIGNHQSGWFTNWYVFHNPFSFFAFWVYFTCAVASTNRAPFDLPEAESELVAGFMTEYSGFRWVVFFMAEYAAMFVVSGLAVVLFLGAWHGPIPILAWLGLTPSNGPLAAWCRNFFGAANFIVKTLLCVTAMIWLRWTLPRLRIDQVMTTCLKYCVPLASAMLFGVMVWCYSLPHGLLVHLREAPARWEQPQPKFWELSHPPVGFSPHPEGIDTDARNP